MHHAQRGVIYISSLISTSDPKKQNEIMQPNFVSLDRSGIFSSSMIFIPWKVNGNHWFLIHISGWKILESGSTEQPRKMSITIYDSYGKDNKRAVNKAISLLSKQWNNAHTLLGYESNSTKMQYNLRYHKRKKL